MKNDLTITQVMQRSKKLKENGKRFTHIGIGPMSENLIRAALELSKEKDFPLILIASRNQVDSDDLGGGYVCNFNQERFVKKTSEIADEIGYNGLCYFCRDHGGPWQRDNERSARLPVEEAMAIAKKSYLDDIKSGFHLLHIDPTKDPFCGSVVPLSLVLERTVELISYIETERKKLGIDGIAYEVGTEETMGGLIDPEAFEGFIKELKVRLNKLNLPMPLFVVGQTGTLTRLTSNVGHYDNHTAAVLSRIVDENGTGLKEHNGDYLSNKILLEHPVIGVTAMNVAPEFGLVETEAILELCATEEKFIEKEKRSNVKSVISKYAVNGQRWRKWMVGDKRETSVEEISASFEDCELITKMCGHYTLNEPEVKNTLAVLRGNLKEIGIDTDFYIIKKIKDSIDRYIYCFNLYNLTSELRKTV